MRESVEKVKIITKQNPFYFKSLSTKVLRTIKPYLNGKHIPSIDRFIQPLLPYHFDSLYLAPEMTDVLVKIQRALDKGVIPEVNKGGTCESYILKDEDDNPLAIFKPGLKRWAHEPLKEVAAYYLDYHGFANVPPTVFATLTSPHFKNADHRRFGSCQLFIENSIVFMKVSKLCNDVFPVDEMRRIAILDIRLINPDRHTSNVLVQNASDGLRLIPIDHGSVLPETFFGACFFWLNYPEMQNKFSGEELAYIEELDPLLDAYYLTEELQLSKRSAENMIITTTLLKEGAQRGLNLFHIGSLIIRRRKEVDGKNVYLSSGVEDILKSLSERRFRSWDHFYNGVRESVITRIEQECA